MIVSGQASGEEPVIQIGPSNATVSPGQSVTLLCITRNDDAKISWLKDGRLITHSVNKRHEVRQDGSLKIDDVQQGDSGEYKCVASNQIGLTTARAHLTVTGTLTFHSHRHILSEHFLLRGKFISGHFSTHYPRRDVCAEKLTCQLFHSKNASM